MTPQNAPALVSVPNIVGLPAGSAFAALRAVGLVPGLGRELVQMDCGDGVGTVLGQTPSPGTQLPRGSAVNYTVGVLPRAPYQCP